MVAANGNIEPEFAVDAHKRELVRIALVVEELGEVGLVTFYVPNVNERDALAKMPCGIFKCLDRINRIDRIIFNAEARNRRASGARVL